MMRALLLGVTVAVGLAQNNTPTQVKLAYAGHDGMRVLWKTDNQTASSCQYGLTAALGAGATGSARNYFPGGGWYHVVKLAQLQFNSTYYYQCGDGGSLLTPVLSFRTPPPVGSSATVRTAIFGDWGWEDSVSRPTIPIGGLQANWSATLVRQLLETLKDNNGFDSVWMVGDIAYADDGFGHLDIGNGGEPKYGGLFDFKYEVDYDGWMDWIANLTDRFPWMVSPGNHESECHSPYCIVHLNDTGLHLNNFTAFNARFAMPSAESNGVMNMWFSWDVANVHFVSLDTSTDFPGAPEGETGDSGFPFLPAGSFGAPGQYMAWLEADLAAARANPNITWIIGGAHRPFSSFPYQDVQALFKKYSVDMYFAGHTHSYLRWDASAFNDSTVHVTVGGAGCDEMPYPSDQMELPPPGGLSCREWCNRPAVRGSWLSGDADQDPCDHCTVAGSDPVYVSDKMAIGVLTAQGNSLTWQLLRAPDGLVLDTVTLTK